MNISIAPPQCIYELGLRQNQEDAIFPPEGTATPADRLFIVCDGMGGHECGEIASQTACETIGHYISTHIRPQDTLTRPLLEEAIAAGYDALDENDSGNQTQKKMGTTLTLLRLNPDGCLIAHIGDSRIYHIRPSERYIWHTRDHSLAYDLYEAGELTWDGMKTFPRKNVITRAMMAGMPRRSKPTIQQITDVQPGDFFFLCSDGMLEDTEDENLLHIFSDPDTSDKEKINILKQVTAHNKDNHSAYFIRILGTDDDPKHTFSLFNLFK